CSGRASSLSPRPAVIRVVDHLPDVACSDVAVEGKPWEQAELAMKEWTATVAMLMAALLHDDVTATSTCAAAASSGAAAAGAGEEGQAVTKSTADTDEPSALVSPPSPRIPPLSVKLPLNAFSRPRPRKATSLSQQATSPSQQATSPSQHASSPSQHASSPSDQAFTQPNALNVDPSLCARSDVPPAAPAAAPPAPGAAAAAESMESTLQDSFYLCHSSLSFSFASDSFRRSTSSSNSGCTTSTTASSTAADVATIHPAPPTIAAAPAAPAAAAAGAAAAAVTISLSSILAHLVSNARTLADPSLPPGSLRKSLLLAEMFVAARWSAPVFEAYLGDKPGGHELASDWSTQLPRRLAEGVLGAFEWVAVGLERAAAAAATAAMPTRTKIST
ncbi:unnamed protein product, partial [Closterium sp. Yama58-4]